ncbi:phosphatidylethanolamine-binding protein [Pyronema omphalodes]|nr:phosphatidylethanolamine-binding protein [Pyronema omphalodes]
MFSKYSVLATTFLWISSALATNHNGIPQAFTTGFDPQSGLQITYDTVGTTAVKDGQDLSGKDLSKVPKFALGESSGINTNAKFIVLMIDPDVNGNPDVVAPQTLHYMRTDFQPSGQAVNIVSESAPAVKYVGPEATTGGNGTAHRYVFLLYSQPKNFKLQGVDESQRMGFDVKKWRELNRLQPAIAGVHFVATPGVASAVPPATTSCTTKVAPAPSAPAVEVPGTEKPSVGGGSPQTIIHTVTVTADCACATAPTPPAGGVTLTAAPPAATTVTPPAAAVTHKVIVGGPSGLVYTPEFVQASPGDKVVFDFLARNHTVTQSTLENPCVLMPGGMKSGFRANPQSIAGKETFEVTVTDIKPTWWFCAQAQHCQQGMVFAINPADKFPTFKQNAMKGTNVTTPIGANATTPNLPVFTGVAAGLNAKVVSLIMGLAAAMVLLA